QGLDTNQQRLVGEIATREARGITIEDRQGPPRGPRHAQLAERVRQMGGLQIGARTRRRQRRRRRSPVLVRRRLHARWGRGWKRREVIGGRDRGGRGDRWPERGRRRRRRRRR